MDLPQHAEDGPDDGWEPFIVEGLGEAAGTGPDGLAPAQPNRAAHRQIALVLEEMSYDVEALGASLCADPEVAMRHSDMLQAIDLIAQKQRSLAALLLAECPEDGIEQIAIDVLRERMRLLVD